MAVSLWQRLRLHVQRWYWRRHAQHPLLKSILHEPISNRPFLHNHYLVIDLETTSLQPEQGEIASIGWVVIEKGIIHLNQSAHFQLSLEKEVGQSAVFHQLTDSDLEQGSAIGSAMNRLLEAAQHSILVFHNAELDLGFINRYLVKQCGAPLLLPVEDTLQREKAILLRRKATLEPGDLRLHQCRQRYGLPPLPAHDALTDALATAELFLAMNLS